MCLHTCDRSRQRVMDSTTLRSIRSALGWSQTRLAEELGVQRNTVTRWEMGLNPIPLMARKLLAAICARGQR